MNNRIIFLDVDGVLNCELLYRERHRYDAINPMHWLKTLKWWIPFALRGFKPKIYNLSNYVSNPKHELFEYRFARFKDSTCRNRMRWLDELCQETGAKIVISSVWRSFFTIQEWQLVFKKLKLHNSFVLDTTSGRERERGQEIKNWLSAHPEVSSYAIIDDDSDMLPEQKSSFFQTDPYSGLTPTTCYRIGRHFKQSLDSKV